MGEFDETNHFRSEVNEDIVWVDFGFSIPNDIVVGILGITIETKFRNRVVVYRDKITEFHLITIVNPSKMDTEP